VRSFLLQTCGSVGQLLKTCYEITALSWVFPKRVGVVSYRRSGKTYRSKRILEPW